MGAIEVLKKDHLTEADVRFLKKVGYVISVYPRRKEVVVNGFKRYPLKG